MISKLLCVNVTELGGGGVGWESVGGLLHQGLQGAVELVGAVLGVVGVQGEGVGLGALAVLQLGRVQEEGQALRAVVVVAGEHAGQFSDMIEIGRASCRERV